MKITGTKDETAWAFRALEVAGICKGLTGPDGLQCVGGRRGRKRNADRAAAHLRRYAAAGDQNEIRQRRT